MGQRHSDEKGRCPEKFQQFLEDFKSKQLSQLPADKQERFKELMLERIAWQKFDPEMERYNEKTPMNSYDVLKCSQACFHVFECLSSLLPEDERPPRMVEIDIKAYKQAEAELK